MSPSPSGSWMSGSFSIFSEVSSVSNTDPERSEDCGSGTFIAKEFDGVGDKGSRVTTLDVEKTLGAFLEDFQPCDHIHQMEETEISNLLNISLCNTPGSTPTTTVTVLFSKVCGCAYAVCQVFLHISYV